MPVGRTFENPTRQHRRRGFPQPLDNRQAKMRVLVIGGTVYRHLIAAGIAAPDFASRWRRT
jgi:hypothetical protein